MGPPDILLVLNCSDLCSGLILAALLLFIGDKIVEGSPTVRRLGIMLAITVFLLSMLARLTKGEPQSARSWLELMSGALLTGAAALGFLWIVLTPCAWLYQGTVGTLLEQAKEWEREAKLRRDEEKPRLAEEQQRAERARLVAPPPPPPPPPPTRDERAQAARERYLANLRLLRASGLEGFELSAAEAQAKHCYLRELDEVMK